MNIGIDLDDVVFEFVKPTLLFFNERYKRNVLFEEVSSYNFSEVFDIDLNKLQKFICEIINDEFHLNMELCDFAKEAILDLLKENNIYFITSRVYRGNTLESLQKHFSNFELHFSSNPYLKTSGKTKSTICIEKKIDFMIEDSPEHALDCADAGIKVFLIDRPWNQNFEHKNVIRVKDWKEIKNKIEEFK
jgi:uncharacterized HAD superfamily protein